MDKRIAFFSVGFAFNRAVRLKYYEKIFPKNVEIFLITTDKYGKAEDEREKWNLKRTKVIILKHNPIKNLMEIRKICNNNKISRVSNLGHPFGAFPLIFSSLFNKRKVLLYYLGDVLEIFKTTKMSFKKVRLFLILSLYFILTKISSKSALVGYKSYIKAPYFFLSRKEKFYYLVAPVNSDLFRPYDKSKARKELGIGKKDKMIIYVGRISYLKGGDVLSKLIKLNPDIKFFVVGKWNEKEIPKFKAENLKIIERIENKDLPRYYSAADLTFVYNRQGDQPQIVGSESLACGTPVLHTKRVNLPDEDFVIKIKDDIDDANKKVKMFLNRSLSERKKISRKAREYAVKNMSNKYWKEKYLDFYIR